MEQNKNQENLNVGSPEFLPGAVEFSGSLNPEIISGNPEQFESVVENTETVVEDGVVKNTTDSKDKGLENVVENTKTEDISGDSRSVHMATAKSLNEILKKGHGHPKEQQDNISILRKKKLDADWPDRDTIRKDRA
jgi:hypothetical protein